MSHGGDNINFRGSIKLPDTVTLPSSGASLVVPSQVWYHGMAIPPNVEWPIQSSTTLYLPIATEGSRLCLVKDEVLLRGVALRDDILLPVGRSCVLPEPVTLSRSITLPQPVTLPEDIYKESGEFCHGGITLPCKWTIPDGAMLSCASSWKN